jgi:hypothetical protein
VLVLLVAELAEPEELEPHPVTTNARAPTVAVRGMRSRARIEDVWGS